jgi:hypothetical protein
LAVIAVFLLASVLLEVFSCFVCPEVFFDPKLGGTLTFPLGSLFLLLTPMYYIQMSYGLNIFGYIKSSGFSKKMMWDAANVIYGGLMILAYSIVVINRVILVYNHPEFTKIAVMALIEAAIMAIFFNIYSAFVYKYYIIAVVLFLLIYFPVYFSMIGMGFDITEFMNKIQALSFGQAVGIGYGMVIVSLIIYYVCTRLCYRVPISKIVFRQYFKKR